MTKRQRAKYLDEESEDLLELPVGMIYVVSIRQQSANYHLESKKRKLTQEEVTLRRTEVLRKREQQRKQKLEDIHVRVKFPVSLVRDTHVRHSVKPLISC